VNAAYPDYFRRDQADGITGPDFSKDSTYAEHIVRARGKRTQLTSVSLDPLKIKDFGPALYRVLRPKLDNDHTLVEHGPLMQELRRVAASSSKEDRARALQALRYAERRQEGLISWNFSLQGVQRKELIPWAMGKIQQYFTFTKV